MTVFCMEMRSTANWNDVRYRAYTTSQRKADDFKTVAKIKFTDSGHHIIPTVKEHSGKRLPLNNLLADHVRETMKQRAKPKQKAMASVLRDARNLLALLAKPSIRNGNPEALIEDVCGKIDAALNSVRVTSVSRDPSLRVEFLSENPLLVKEGYHP